MTRADGSVRERDSLAVVLHERLDESEPTSHAQIELMEKLVTAAPEVDIGGLMLTPHPIGPDVRECGILIYQSSPDRAT
jgi:hypothetical protein